MLALVFRKKGKKIKRGVEELYAYSLTHANPLLNINTGICLNYAKKADYQHQTPPIRGSQWPTWQDEG
jgi:hypothetical protein